MPTHITTISADDLIVSLKMQYAKRFVDDFEKMIEQHIHRAKKAGARSTDTIRVEGTRTFRYAFFLRYYALFEAHLRTLCDRLGADAGIRLRLSDMDCRYLLQGVETYLTKAVGRLSPLRFPEWKEIKLYGQIRNRIVHFDGVYVEASGMPKDLKQFIDKTSSLHLDRNNRICFRKPFC